MTKEQILFMLDMRPELPERVFSEDERATYGRIVDKMCELAKDKEPFAPMTEVEVVDDIDLKGGCGRFSDKIGRRAIVKGNYQWIHGGCGHGPSYDLVHPRVMTFEEMDARDGNIPNSFRALFEYELVFDYVDHLCFGSGSAWWPHDALKKYVA